MSDDSDLEALLLGLAVLFNYLHDDSPVVTPTS